MIQSINDIDAIDITRSVITTTSVPRYEHYHNYNELYYLIDGETKYFIGDEIFNVNKGNLAFVPENVIHKTTYTASKHSQRLLICFTNEFAGEEYAEVLNKIKQNKIIVPSATSLLEVDALILKMETEYKTKPKNYFKMLQLLLGELLISIERQSCIVKQEDLNENERIIQAAAKYINDNFSGELTLPIIAKKSAMSEGYFSKTFKHVTGFGVSEYITLVRILNSEKLLKNTSLPITEIATRCGYNDSNYFAAIFKKKNGITPYKYSKITKP